MNRWKNEHGFVMLEVVVVMMIFMMMASTLYGLAGMEHRRICSRVSEDEAYYASISAVRLMAREVVNEEAEEGTAANILVKGMGKRTVRIVFEPETGEESIEIPVTIWSKRDGNYLFLTAEAESGGKTRSVTMQLVKKMEQSEVLTENLQIKATESEAIEAEEDHWVPVAYGL